VRPLSLTPSLRLAAHVRAALTHTNYCQCVQPCTRVIPFIAPWVQL
jgi:hypothetical protein